MGLGVGAKSLSELGRMGDAAPLALIIRPGQPPHAEFGKGTDPETDPLIRVTMNQVSIDFYAWSLDRYIRAMTMTMDLDVPANLEVGPDGLTPVIKNINVANATLQANTNAAGNFAQSGQGSFATPGGTVSIGADVQMMPSYNGGVAAVAFCVHTWPRIFGGL